MIDQYGWPLCYVWYDAGDGQAIVFNQKMVRDVVAVLGSFLPDVRSTYRIQTAQDAALAAGAGLRAACGRADTSLIPVVEVRAQRARGVEAGSSCNPSYPTVCITPDPPILDCKDVPHVDLNVPAPDRHRLDADHDRRGCKSNRGGKPGSGRADLTVDPATIGRIPPRCSGLGGAAGLQTLAKCSQVLVEGRSVIPEW